MGSSLILTGGAAVTKTLKEAITQTAHGFTVGDVIRWNPTSSPPKYVLAQADSAANAEVAGVVSSRTDSNNFEVTYHGYIDLPQFSGISAPVMFLSSVAGGSLSSTPPSAVGTVVKPILTRNTNGSGHLVMNYLGTQIGGSSTISVDEIQPVGTIMPFAGTAIPDTWLPCNATSYRVTDYPELYSKLCYDTGDRVPMYGHIVELTLSAIPSGTTVGDYILLPKTGQSFPGTVSSTGEEDTLNALILVEGQIRAIDTANNKLTVSTAWRYNTTKKYFEYVNAAFKPASNYTITAGTWVPANVRGTINATTVTAVAITHFYTPDLTSRFLVGADGSALVPVGGQPDNFTFSLGSNGLDESRNNVYSMGAFGGEEKHTLTTAEMPAHDHPRGNASDYYWLGNESSTAKDFSFSAGTNPAYELSTRRGVDSQGGNDPHNNLPPYLAVRYIIKAKSYTRAAIVDGIDLPYNNLLVRDLRTRNVGGSNGDLGIYTNTPGDAGTGTLRAVFTQGGTFAIGNAVSSSSVGDFANFVLRHNGNSEIALVKADPSGVDVGVSLRCYSSRGTVAAPLAVQSGDVLSRISGFGWDGTIYGNLSGVGGRNGGFNVVAEEAFTSNTHGTALSFEFTPRGRSAGAEGMRFTSDSRLGIGTATPGASLDVNGTLKHKNPAFLAGTAAADIVTTKQVNYTTLVYSTTSINDTYNGVNVYNPSTGVFTAPITGRYYFSARILFAHSSGSWRLNGTEGGGGFYIAKNFGTASEASIGPAAVTPNSTTVDLVHIQVNADGYANLTAGDTVRVVYYGKPFNANHNCFGGIFIG